MEMIKANGGCISALFLFVARGNGGQRGIIQGGRFGCFCYGWRDGRTGQDGLAGLVGTYLPRLANFLTRRDNTAAGREGLGLPTAGDIGPG